VVSGLERTLGEDVAYGFRMLVDMAERSLSESPFVDPTTAVQAIDRLHDGLRQLATRVIPDGRHHDRTGHLRLTTPAMAWGAYVHLAFDEIRLAGTESPQVTRRLVAALHDPGSRPPGTRSRVGSATGTATGGGPRHPRDQRDLNMALVPDAQGIGVAAGAKPVADPSAPAKD
jgi:hypothetical protein